ncbi:MAG: DNA-binding HxlR family transcriptional regulator [Colwellia polaris]|jgi:DNA-binding HxlR family transcriptional regulator
MSEENEMKVWCSTEDWCPVTAASQILGRKWHPVIIHRLVKKNDLSFNELKREANGISSKVLSETLQDLQDKNIVEKEIISESPKKVSYTLTSVGKSLEPVILGMAEWGRKRLQPAKDLDSSFEIPSR